MKAAAAGIVTFFLVLAGLAVLAHFDPAQGLTVVAIAAMLGIAVAATFLCGDEPSAAARAIDWYWFGAFALAWGFGTVGLSVIDGLTDRARLEAEALLLSASVMGYAIGHLAGLRRARPSPATASAPAAMPPAQTGEPGEPSSS